MSMDALGLSLWFQYLTLLFAVMATVILTPMVITVFRSSVSRSMARAAAEDVGAADVVHRAGSGVPGGAAMGPSVSVGPGWGPRAGFPVPAPPLPRVAATTALQPAPRQVALMRHSGMIRRRLALAYGLGALGQAVIAAAVLVLSGGFTALSIWVLVLAVLALPVAPTVLLVVAPRPAGRFAWVAAAVMLAWFATWLAGDAMLGLLLFTLYGAAPLAVFLLLNVRFWRAAAPLVMVVSSMTVLGWLLFLDAARQVGVDGALAWAFRLAGASAGLVVGMVVLAAVGRGYQAKRFSDQMIFIYVWWLLITMVEVAVMVVGVGAVGFLALLGPVVAVAASRALLVGVAADRPPAARLLLLRVFGHDRRTERLMDELTMRWQPVGTVDLIAGRDLALRSIAPGELYAFLTGRLSRAFVAGAAEIPERLARRDERPDPDGRFRVNQFFCHQNTWQHVLDALVLSCDGVLMDLRDFDESKLGCLYEIGRLAEHVGEKPIVLLVNERTRLDIVEQAVAAEVFRPDRPPHPWRAGTYALMASGAERGTVDAAVALLLGATPVSR